MINQYKYKVGYSEKDVHVKFQNVKAALNKGKVIEARSALKNEQASVEMLSIKKMLTNQILTSYLNDNFAHLVQHLEPVSLRSGEDLHKPGEHIRYIYFPEEAVVSHLSILADGRTTEINMIGRDGVVGHCAVFGSQPPAHCTEVIVGGSALRVKTEAFKQEFFHDVLLQTSLLDYTNAQITQISQRAICNVHHLAEERLCCWLLMLHDRVKTSQLPLTQDQIARYLGVHRPSITHIAQSLREKGAINYVRGFINILNRRPLEKLACECYSVLKKIH